MKKFLFIFCCFCFCFYNNVFSQKAPKNYLIDIRKQSDFQQFLKQNSIKQIVKTTNYISDTSLFRQTLYQLTSIFKFDTLGNLIEHENWYNAGDVAYLNKELHFDTLTVVQKDKLNNYHQSLKIDSFILLSTYFFDEKGRLVCDLKRFHTWQFKSSYLVSSSSFNSNGELVNYKSYCNNGGENDDLFYKCNDISLLYEKNQLIVTENLEWNQFLQTRAFFKDTLTLIDTCALKSIFNNSEEFSFVDPNKLVIVESWFEPREEIFWNPNATIALSTSSFVNTEDFETYIKKVIHFNPENSKNKTVQHKISKVDIEKQDFFRMHQQFADSANQFYFPETFGNNFFTVFERDTVKNEIYITEYNYKFDNKLNQTLKIFGGMEVRDFSNHLLKYYRGKVDNQYWFIENLDGYILDGYTYNGDEIVAYTLKISKEPKFRKITDPLKLKYKTVLKKTSKNKQIMPLEPRFKIENKELGILKIDGRLYQFKTY